MAETDFRLRDYFATYEAKEYRTPTRRWKDTETLIATVLTVLDDFPGTMSTRQVFYQCVSRGVIPNQANEYDRVQRLLVDLRRNDEIEDDRIVDRTRSKHQRPGWNGLEDILADAKSQYRRNLWRDQRAHVMIALEKDALAGVFAEVVDEYGASLWTLRGFPSLALLFDWRREILELNYEDKAVHIYYFGDFDPSGLQIEQTTKRELASEGAEFTWKRAGLLVEDFKRFEIMRVEVKRDKPATEARKAKRGMPATKAREAKRGDPNARRFLEEFGDTAAELDALPPDELRQRIRTQIERHIHREEWERLKAQENAERESFDTMTRQLKAGGVIFGKQPQTQPQPAGATPEAEQLKASPVDGEPAP
jgi:hypothetical protein